MGAIKGGSMRIWHKDLIEVLPKNQLVAQWREILAIKGAIIKKGTPNHILVNKVMDYDMVHLYSYSKLLLKEFRGREYKYSDIKFHELYLFCCGKSKKKFSGFFTLDKVDIFDG